MLNRKLSWSRFTIFVLFMLSGATGLVYEVIWLRQLVLIFGATLFATSAVLCTFMSGLALGAFCAGRYLNRISISPLRLYGLLEVCIGLYVLVVPFLFKVLTPLFRFMWKAGGAESFYLFSLAKLIVVLAVLLPPTALMGATLPVLARQIVDDPSRIGGTVGGLYAVNIFGAVFGTFLAGVVAVPLVGVSATLLATACVNMGLGVAAVWLSRLFPRVELEPGVAVASTSPKIPSNYKVRIALSALALSGFAAMVLEVAWTRLLSLVLGSSVYAFSLMLIAFLLGLAAGGASVSALLRRRPETEPGMLFAVLLALAGMLAYLTAFQYQRLPELFAHIYFVWEPSSGQWLLVQLVFGLLVMFPATFAFGGMFPTVLQLHRRELAQVGGSVGDTYASNTLGTIAGSLAGGFVLIPLLGVRDTVLTAAALEISLGLAVAGAVAVGRSRTRLALGAAMVAALLLLLILRPGWDVLLMNIGGYVGLQDAKKGVSWDGYLTSQTGHDEIVYAREGLTGSVLVAKDLSDDNLYLKVNGKGEASSIYDMETQLLLGHLPLLLQPQAREVMVIGMGSGITAGAVAVHPVQKIQIVEVEAKMVKAAEYFKDFNRQVLDDPRVSISVNDGRNHLELSEEKYDLIICAPSNPWMTVASNLFTEDFFRLTRKRLRPGGIAAQWMQAYNLSIDDVRSVLAAFRSAFPQVMMFRTYGGFDLIILGSEAPLKIDMEDLARRMQTPSLHVDLARVPIRSPHHFLPFFLMGNSEIDDFVRGAPKNTDDNARVEFSAPLTVLANTDSNLEILNRFEGDPLDYVHPSPVSHAERDRLRLLLAGAWLYRGDRDRAASLAKALLHGPSGGRATDFLNKYKLE